MGGRGSSSAVRVASFQMQTQPPVLQPTQQAATQANQRTFDDTDSRPYHDLKNGRNYFQSQNMTIDQQIATQNYLATKAESGSLYSMSQNMNHALATGQQLTANQQYVYNNLMSAMHNLGENVNLTRYDHSDMINNMLRQKGINTSYEKLTASQLANALVGTKYGEERLVSTSYNDFKNAPAQSSGTFKSRAVKISYRAAANTQAMMPGDTTLSNGTKNSLGEIVLAPSQGKANYTITGVRFNGQRARMKGTQSYNLPQVEIFVDVSG